MQNPIKPQGPIFLFSLHFSVVQWCICAFVHLLTILLTVALVVNCGLIYSVYGHQSTYSFMLVNVQDFEDHALRNLPKNARDYYASGANDMITLRENREAYRRLRIIPRALVDVSSICTVTTVLGARLPSPICIAPTAMQCMAHPDGELATARAANKSGTLLTLSSWSTTTLEDVANAAPNAPKWFQLYVYRDRRVAADLVHRAEASGYLTLAVTVDTPVLGRREPDVRNSFALPSHLTMANFVSSANAPSMNAASGGSALSAYVASLIDSSLTWEDIKWLRSITKMKIVVKGIMSEVDARLAVEHGVDGIWVSNHGARQVDTAPATIEVLSDICRIASRRGVEVYIDGGITRGTDVFKALALGATAVFIGRPVLWGLAHSGEQGVSEVLKLLNDELKLAMKLSGCPTLRDINKTFICTDISLRSRL